jgi:hypothetical protein
MAFKKFRMLTGSHIINIDYKASNASDTIKIKNARILIIKVDTLQSYEDSEIKTRTTFDGTHHVIYVFGHAYEYKWNTTPPTAMPYKITYFDGGPGHDGVSGTKVIADSINSSYNRSIYSTLDFNNYPGASYGTWHAVVYRADTGDSSPPDTYTSNDSNSVMDIAFTVQQEALPEFPTPLAGIVIGGVCAGIYCWMRKRKVKTSLTWKNQIE